MGSRNILRNGRRENIRQVAYGLADTGSYEDWRAIEGILCTKYGVIETRRLFVDLEFRQNLNRRCDAARRRRDNSVA